MDTETVIETSTSLIKLQEIVCLPLFTKARIDGVAEDQGTPQPDIIIALRSVKDAVCLLVFISVL